ncbi:general stress protein [Paenibacillus sp. UMB7766-LJ446]|uniref:general stress protein n=1 Tax=Paenibacillus sp. UMB7766-LJ446 TaxID=3046313 RepID=UPI00254D748E|nr:general stress protein [Paenibacillus sp. UMB7766-LJ446]MDK8193329.1 general stress protein [Paenibacillus sp. UMB7766-LJ446]
MQKKIVGVFNTEREASSAIEGLKAQGFTSDEISVVTQDRDELKAIREETGTKAPEGVAAGAATGGVLGGVAGLLAGIGALAIPGIGPILAAGPIAAAFTGAAVGAGAGGLVGGLVGLGIPEEDARQYEEYVQSGKILLLVDSTDRDTDVYEVFSNNSPLNRDRMGVHREDVPAERPDLDMEERRLEAQNKAARFGNNTFL